MMAHGSVVEDGAQREEGERASIFFRFEHRSALRTRQPVRSIRAAETYHLYFFLKQ